MASIIGRESSLVWNAINTESAMASLQRHALLCDSRIERTPDLIEHEMRVAVAKARRSERLHGFNCLGTPLRHPLREQCRVLWRFVGGRLDRRVDPAAGFIEPGGGE